MKIIITGNLGFVGQATQKLLEENGHEVVGFDIMQNRDIRDIGQLEACVQAEKPDRILHLAAIARFSEADKDPKLAVETNVRGTSNVASVAQKYHIPLVYSSTGSAIMPLNDYTPPFNEEIPARGNSIYGSTKAIGEFYVREAKPYIILRYSHLYGKDKVRHGLIGGFIDRIKRGLEPQLYGGSQTNDFLYIKDVARANMLALTAQWPAWNQVYHIGTGHELSAKEAGIAVCKVFGYKGKIKTLTQRTVDPNSFCFDVSKAKEMLGFEADFSFKEGLEDMKKQMYNVFNDTKQTEDTKREKNLSS